MKLTEIECSRGSEMWEVCPPQPGTCLMVVATGEVMEIVTIDRNEDGGWHLLCARERSK